MNLIDLRPRTLCASCSSVVIGNPQDVVYCDPCQEHYVFNDDERLLRARGYEQRILEYEMKQARRELADWNERLNGGSE